MWIDEVVDIEERIDNIKTKLIELTEGEEDQELQEYNEYLINSIDIIYDYIRLLEEDATKIIQQKTIETLIKIQQNRIQEKKEREKLWEK